MSTFSVYRLGIKALIDGRSIEAAEAAVAEKLAGGSGGSGPSSGAGTAASRTMKNASVPDPVV